MAELNLKPEKILEPSAGMGVFIDTMKLVNPDARITAFEKDKLTGLLLSKLHANEGMDIHVEGFERIQPSELGKFDLAISNIPFGETKVFDPIYSNHKSVMKRTISKSLHGVQSPSHCMATLCRKDWMPCVTVEWWHLSRPATISTVRMCIV